MDSRSSILAWLLPTTLLLTGCGPATPPATPPPQDADCTDPQGGLTPCVDEPAANPAPSAAKPPAAEAITFGLTMIAQLPAPIGGDPFPVQPGDPLPTGAQVSFTVEASSDVHLYVFQAAPGGEVSALFPSAALGLANPLRQGTASRVPPGDGAFKLNDADMGVTHLYFVVSTAPQTELAEAFQAIAAGKIRSAADRAALKKVTAVVPASQAAECQPLDLAAPLGEGCRRPVGEDLRASLDAGEAPGGIEGGSLLLRSPAGQSLIVAVLPFDHVPLAKYERSRPKSHSRGIIMED
ncbi:MAG: DUF4384 domain-containing protein [Deltaproteobacteria bacterium]|nr:DUF4384 domain-containing protein [Deltaproteobacteria bacterium]